MTDEEIVELVNKAISNNDERSATEYLCNIIYTDMNFSTDIFDRIVRRVRTEFPTAECFSQKFNGNPALVSKTKTTFVKEDFSDAVFELKENFCDERIDDVKVIGKALYNEAAAKSDKAAVSEKAKHKKTSGDDSGEKKEKKASFFENMRAKRAERAEKKEKMTLEEMSPEMNFLNHMSNFNKWD